MLPDIFVGIDESMCAKEQTNCTVGTPRVKVAGIEWSYNSLSGRSCGLKCTDEQNLFIADFTLTNSLGEFPPTKFEVRDLMKDKKEMCRVIFLRDRERKRAY